MDKTAFDSLSVISEEELHSHFDSIMERAMSGERFLIERSTGQNAVLVPLSDLPPLSFSTTIEVDSEGHHYVRVPETVAKLLGWNVGDSLVWLMDEPGRVIVRKAEDGDDQPADMRMTVIDVP